MKAFLIHREAASRQCARVVQYRRSNSRDGYMNKTHTYFWTYWYQNWTLKAFGFLIIEGNFCAKNVWNFLYRKPYWRPFPHFFLYKNRRIAPISFVYIARPPQLLDHRIHPRKCHTPIHTHVKQQKITHSPKSTQNVWLSLWLWR